MKCLLRNKTKIYYASYIGKEEITDDYGNKTGQYDYTYGDPQIMYAYVSPNVGEMEIRRFGEILSYDKTIVLDNYSKYLINEQSRLWVDITPELDDKGALALDKNGKVITPHDHIVKRVSNSLNSAVIAIERVKVND